MRSFKYLLAAAAIGSCMTLSQTSSASPLVTGLTEAGSTASDMTSGLVEKVSHRRHYRHRGHYRHKRYYRHRYPHRRYYRKRYRYYDDDYYYPSYGYYPYYYPYSRRHYYGGPVITFGFGF